MYDFVGDVHGCIDELWALMGALGYPRNDRKLVFVGDINDRGPNSVATLKLTMEMCKSGMAFAVTGNHDDKLRRFLKGNKVQPKHGLKETLDQISCEPESFRAELSEWLNALPYRLVLDDGKVLVAHAGLPERMHLALESGRIRDHALYGDVDGKTDAAGLPIRKDWTKDYTGSRVVVHGHVPVKEPDIRNNVYNIDTGCCFGGKLTALRYPEMEIVSVQAARAYAKREDW